MGTKVKCRCGQGFASQFDGKCGQHGCRSKRETELYKKWRYKQNTLNAPNIIHSIDLTDREKLFANLPDHLRGGVLN